MSTPAGTRADIVAFLRRELVGPDPRPEFLEVNNGDEVLRPQDPPRLRYSAGVLFPGGATIDEQENAHPEELMLSDSGPAEGDEPEEVIGDRTKGDVDDTTEHEVNRANEFLPSAMGLSALIRLPHSLKVTITAARYEKKIKDNVGRPDRDGKWQPHHYRLAVNPPPLEIACAEYSTRKPVVRYFPVKLEGQTYKKAAEEMGISPLTVKEYLVAATRSIRSNLSEHAGSLFLLTLVVLDLLA